MEKDKGYFPNLNGVRFIAALMVIISHIELNKSFFDYSNSFQTIKRLGEQGVSLFFVLSGFLITFLLLQEKKDREKINFKFFYFRRILRIWPLYFLIVVVSLFVLPHFEMFNIPNSKLEYTSNAQFVRVLVLLVFFMPNILIIIKRIPFATQTWSIGTEEQFYLIWPLLINKKEQLMQYFLGIILSYNIILLVMHNAFFDDILYIKLIRGYIAKVQLDSLTFGALGAYLLFTKNKLVDFVINNSTFYLSIFLLIISQIFSSYIVYFRSSINAVFFILIILNLVHNKNIARLLEHKFFFKMGEISYGLYMYHQIVIVFFINCFIKWNFFSNSLLYIFTFLGTVLVSHLSYKFFEKPFLLKKEKYKF
ncbi:peptidoglycan/LPS O-acetylase OafA/YrhL [Flavobacterium cutihirudinis]|uniref:Peptidoglycan/LPS O-acetylase OafA/YrhL n=1 Tax=Flavobacterium cutihirudinis TaxID=1265740 RepID=A0A3D9FKN5_9FLAO|nr:acyltransferase [Flavobacterium cutihirudinis]RED19572.1 peptidoglycan/LPS O-acetylase OafA/YrhL [Flavobacterium cutihirudinis]